ncbi:unnamed protein product [Anisakis simplex]|uniref:SHSP domain-containing protein n=1 Tax=Anisakis simplex TaxID=6269 RepID=A0A0M3JDC0_ANISI|nr:unnamed protein product [Anisakis simplex]
MASIHPNRHPVRDLFSAHNFDVDIDIALPPPLQSASTTSSVGSVDASSRNNSTLSTTSSSTVMNNSGGSRPLSLEDYKRRKGLI